MEFASLHAKQGEAAAVASIYLYRQKDPALRFPEARLVPAGDPSNAWPLVLGLEPSDRLTGKRTPPGGGSAISQDVHVEAIEHTIDGNGWETRLLLGKAEDAGSFWEVGTSQLGVDTTIGY
jgi:hypothetical protein